MAWEMLPTDYTDAIWSGLRKYTQIENSDGTVSFQDVTTYTGKEKSFFGALQANRMNEALNTIMSMVENGTDLYEAFQTYFAGQKVLFEGKADSEFSAYQTYTKNLETQGDKVIENIRVKTNSEYDSFTNYVTGLEKEGDNAINTIKTDYSQEMTEYESQQIALFNSWFEAVKGQLSTDVAGQLQNEITEIDERLSNLEYMSIENDFTAPISVDGSGTTLLVDDLGYAIVSDWKI